MGVIVGIFGCREELGPVILLVVTVNTQVLFQTGIGALSLAVGLGWKAVERLVCEPTIWDKDFQNFEVNKVPRSEIIDFGMPWRRQIQSRKRVARPLALTVVVVGMKWVILVNRFTTTRIVS